MTTRRSVLLLVVCAAMTIPASASACDNSELRILDIQFSGTWTVEIEACVGAGILGATTGADANTNDWAIAAFGADPATDIAGFSPPSLTSDGSGGLVQGFVVADSRRCRPGAPAARRGARATLHSPSTVCSACSRSPFDAGAEPQQP